MSTNIQQPARTPLGAQLLTEPGVSAWWASVRPLTDKLEKVPDELKELMKIHFAKGNDIEVNGELSKEGKLGQWAELTKTMMTLIDKIYADAEKAVNDLQDRINGTLQPVPLGTQEALLMEMQVMRSWLRIKGVLDAGGDVGAVSRSIETIATTATTDLSGSGRATIKALREELPAYLKARRLESIIDSSIGRVMQIEAPFLSPVQRAALQLSHATTGGWARLAACFQMTRGAVARTGGKPNQLPGFYVNEELRF